MNSYCRYVDTNAMLEKFYSEEIMEIEENGIGEYFEVDQKTNVKIGEQGYQDVTNENEEQIGDKSNKSKSCNICTKIYETHKSLKRHVQVVHTGIKYPCDWCVYKATTKGNLKTHIQSVHEKIKYSCNQCDHQSTTQ